MDELTEQADIRLTELEDELRSWTIESGSTVSEGSQSAPARPRVSIHRFAKIPQNVPVEDVQGREFTEAEYAYIEFVLDNLYDLIIASALDRSGVQYRNTFAWRYLVLPRSFPRPFRSGRLTSRRRPGVNSIKRLDIVSALAARDSRSVIMLADLISVEL